MVAPRALDSCRRPEGSKALGTRMNKKHLDGSTHEQTIICQVFFGHLVGSRPMKEKQKKVSNDI